MKRNLFVIIPQQNQCFLSKIIKKSNIRKILWRQKTHLTQTNVTITRSITIKYCNLPTRIKPLNPTKVKCSVFFCLSFENGLVNLMTEFYVLFMLYSKKIVFRCQHCIISMLGIKLLSKDYSTEDFSLNYSAIYPEGILKIKHACIIFILS